MFLRLFFLVVFSLFLGWSLGGYFPAEDPSALRGPLFLIIWVIPCVLFVCVWGYMLNEKYEKKGIGVIQFGDLPENKEFQVRSIYYLKERNEHLLIEIEIKGEFTLLSYHGNSNDINYSDSYFKYQGKLYTIKKELLSQHKEK